MTHFEVGADERAPNDDRHRSTHREEFVSKKAENRHAEVERNRLNKDK